MSTASRRRNGSQASCERCRKAKIRCDHQRPICGPCQRRGLELQCWYHPAPLTKQRRPQRSDSPILVQPSSIERNEVTASAVENSSTERLPKFHTWPFMLNDPHGTSRALIHETYHQKAYQEHLAAAKDIVSQLKFLTHIERLVNQYLSFNQVALLPRPIISQLVKSIRDSSATSDYIGDSPTGSTPDILKLAKDLLRSSSTEVNVTGSLDVNGFCELFCGANLRIETLGLLYTTAARSYFCGMDRDGKGCDGFIEEIIRCGSLCLRLARELSSQSNDLIIWLAHENLQLTTLIEGDASLGVWRRAGDLATDIFALSLHREAAYSPEKVPFFLAESRRKTFATVYHIDKIFAAVFYRPPRIPARYADCKAPLDLSEDELFATVPEILEQARKNLSPDGWNIQGGHRPTTWARIRYILAGFREETVELQFRSEQSNNDAEIRNLLSQFQLTWKSLPSHFQYNPDCWTSDLSTGICVMLAKVYLAYLHINFQLYRLLEKDRLSPRPEIIEVSARMLEAVVQIANARSRAFFLPRDLPTIILSYGLPSSAILTTVLQDMTKTFPPNINRSLLIRNLSVLVHQLESVSSPGETNHMFCTQAARIISHKLDQILDNLTTSATTTPSNTAIGLGSPASILQQTQASSSAERSGDTEIMNMDNFDNLDFETWVAGLDIDISSNEWITL
ncbi:uncharacterized protein F4822DRAFT_441461 [Hypoxylon trugodes]|uniref:uncharacterized protein n=1 Tax=Hypoxylon trugodes TaxID=326681 RepID=UPI00219C3700|nr:uncharacterized protein F4822DRAFT_441461 [Hypoxylon trugodes]KAI1392524.1 hypothetical protein F4822DRAFT_441461 [Hypoxylon trugodes]